MYLFLPNVQVKSFAAAAVGPPAHGYPCPPYKLLILDEADSMTQVHTVDCLTGSAHMCCRHRLYPALCSSAGNAAGKAAERGGGGTASRGGGQQRTSAGRAAGNRQREIGSGGKAQGKPTWLSASTMHSMQDPHWGPGVAVHLCCLRTLQLLCNKQVCMKQACVFLSL